MLRAASRPALRLPPAVRRPPLAERLVAPFPPEFFRCADWIVPLLVTVLGGLPRFWNLGRPDAVVFDETYYAKDAWSMYRYGWEHSWQRSAVADPALVGSGGVGPGAHGATLFGCQPTCAEFVVHPPIGKWIIGFGEQIWGLNPVGWRLMPALLGTLAIFILARTARRMFRSTLCGAIAGLLFSFDGLAFVMARTALLDDVQMFFLLAGFSCLVVDRDRTRARMAAWAVHRRREDPGPLPIRESGPRLGVRRWRLLAGVCLGLATATKWNGVFFLLAFMLLSLAWDRGARRAIGVARPTRAVLRADAPWAVLALPVTAIGVFVASYAGWFADTSHGGGWDRFWAQANPPRGFDIPFGRALAGWTPDSLRSFWFYLAQQYQASVNITTPHPYMSNPWSWLVLGRPVAFYIGPSGCSASSGVCSEVLALGNPLLWWLGCASLPYLAWLWLGRRDWRAAAILCAEAAGLLPWMHYAQRTIFSFYAVSFAPFVALAATMTLGAIIGRADASVSRRAWGAATAGTVMIGVVLLFGYFYPLYTGETIPYDDWLDRMWLPSWV
ncbi:dolichyl-phosphate-mannose--protein mannosyltransferase [Actinospica robiniae]|uniref:dolichyl-phosphate-mannose--protein mannosyltransferase n=1 Tax=Actinospica robiniae TaxID=304901 RepID=UPI000687FC10|nr:phospholipid carrier-dependent glycosyltransferase [Actinospica robiniae]